jgi:hypothetical protein
VVEVVSRRIIVLDTASQNEKKARAVDKARPVKHAEAGNVINEGVSASEEIEATAD